MNVEDYNVFGVQMDQEDPFDGDTAFRQLVKLMRGADIQYSSEENYSYAMNLRSTDASTSNNLHYAQYIRDGIVCVSFVAVILIILIIMSVRNNQNFNISKEEEEQQQLSPAVYVTNTDLIKDTVIDIEGGASLQSLKTGKCGVYDV